MLIPEWLWSLEDDIHGKNQAVRCIKKRLMSYNRVLDHIGPWSWSHGIQEITEDYERRHVTS